MAQMDSGSEQILPWIVKPAPTDIDWPRILKSVSSQVAVVYHHQYINKPSTATKAATDLNGWCEKEGFMLYFIAYTPNRYIQRFPIYFILCATYYMQQLASLPIVYNENQQKLDTKIQTKINKCLDKLHLLSLTSERKPFYEWNDWNQSIGDASGHLCEIITIAVTRVCTLGELKVNWLMHVMAWIMDFINPETLLMHGGYCIRIIEVMATVFPVFVVVNLSIPGSFGSLKYCRLFTTVLKSLFKRVSKYQKSICMLIWYMMYVTLYIVLIELKTCCTYFLYRCW